MPSAVPNGMSSRLRNPSTSTNIRAHGFFFIRNIPPMIPGIAITARNHAIIVATRPMIAATLGSPESKAPPAKIISIVPTAISLNAPITI